MVEIKAQPQVYTRTELVWPGKRTQIERIALPFQVVETVNQSRATREQTPMLAGLPPPPLFDGQANPDTAWKNKLIWGENKYVLASLMQGDPSIGLEPLAGMINLIYIDPPFATGDTFSVQAQVGDEEWVKEASIIEETAYRDTWGRGLDSYLQMMYERLVLMRELLVETGSIYVHLDWHVGHYVKLIMDDVFGPLMFQNEIIWHYPDKFATGASKLDHNHDLLLHYSKNEHYIANRVMEPKEAPSRRALRRKVKGKTIDILTDEGKKIWVTYNERKIDDVWRIQRTKSLEEQTPFPTQKTEALINRCLQYSCNPGDLIADFFCGSGTTMAVAEKLGRRWIGCDLSRYAIQVSRKRLLDIAGCQPFQVLNLGQYERKYWQVHVNGSGLSPEEVISQYVSFILGLYHAEPKPGFRHLHGFKAGRWAHVGATDAPVTRAEVIDAVRECQANRYTGLDVLGWEWEMGLHDTVRQEAQRMGVDLRLLHIPREVMDRRAVQAGDVHFYELAYLKASLLQEKAEVTVKLEDFIIPNPDLVPDDVRSKVKKWSDYIDFWAVDWDYPSTRIEE